MALLSRTAPFSAPSASGIKIFRLGPRERLLFWAAIVRADEGMLGLRRRARAALFLFDACLSHASGAAEVPVPGTILLIAFQVVPILFTVTSPSRSTRPVTPLEGRGDPSIRSTRSRRRRMSSYPMARPATRTASSCCSSSTEETATRRRDPGGYHLIDGAA